MHLIQPSPVFIVGMARSGTTLMRAMLSAHRNITIAPETHFINRFVRGNRTRELGSEEEFRTFWEGFRASDRFQELGIDEDRARSAILDAGDFRYQSIFRAVLEEYARMTGKPRWGEKTPHHVNHIDVLLDWFPAARVVIMIRDPRAACASLLAVPWRNSQSTVRRRVDATWFRRLRQVYFDSAYWEATVDRFIETRRGEPRATTVRYEDLVTTPESTLRDLCRYLEEPYDEQMLGSRSWEALSSAPDQVGGWKRQHFESALKPVTTASVAKWRKDLGPLEVALIEANSSAGMARFGYERSSHESLSPRSRLRLSLARTSCAAYWKVRRLAS
jgi:sulfotransferase family protein